RAPLLAVRDLALDGDEAKRILEGELDRAGELADRKRARPARGPVVEGECGHTGSRQRAAVGSATSASMSCCDKPTRSIETARPVASFAAMITPFRRGFSVAVSKRCGI